MRKKLKAYNLNFKLMGKSHSKVYYEEPEFKRPVCCNFGFLIQSMQTNVERKTFSLPFNGLDILKEHGFSDKELKKIIIISNKFSTINIFRTLFSTSSINLNINITT